MSGGVSRWRAVFWLALVLTLVLALRPAVGGLQWFAHADKLQHAAVFFALALLALRAGFSRGWRLWLGLVAFGALIEGGQYFTGTRQADGVDALANAVGAALGAWWPWRRR